MKDYSVEDKKDSSMYYLYFEDRMYLEDYIYAKYKDPILDYKVGDIPQGEIYTNLVSSYYFARKVLCTICDKVGTDPLDILESIESDLSVSLALGDVKQKINRDCVENWLDIISDLSDILKKRRNI